MNSASPLAEKPDAGLLYLKRYGVVGVRRFGTPLEWYRQCIRTSRRPTVNGARLLLGDPAKDRLSAIAGVFGLDSLARSEKDDSVGATVRVTGSAHLRLSLSNLGPDAPFLVEAFDDGVDSKPRVPTISLVVRELPDEEESND